MRSQPRLISVILPVRNSEQTLGAQLDAILSQDYRLPFEIVVVDNGSRDASPRIAGEKAASDPRLRVVDAPHRGANHARNVGRHAARGDLLVYCDADDIVSRTWLSHLVARALHCDAVAGKVDFLLLNEPTTIAWRPDAQKDDLRVGLGFLPYGISANLAVWSDALESVGGWDETFVLGGTEVDLCWRLQLAGYTLCFAGNAVVHYRLRGTIGGVFRQGLRFGRGDVMLYRKFRKYGMQRDSLRLVIRGWLGFVRTALELLRGRERRGAWLFKVACKIGRIWGSIKYRTVLL